MIPKIRATRCKLSLLKLAQERGNVSDAYRVMGYAPQHFYEIRGNYQTYGAARLTYRLPGAKEPHLNRVSEEVEGAIPATWWPSTPSSSAILLPSFTRRVTPGDCLAPILCRDFKELLVSLQTVPVQVC